MSYDERSAGDTSSSSPMLEPKAGRRQWAGLGLLLLVGLLVAMDLGVLFLALPSISAELQPSGAQQLWIMDIYGLVLAGLLVPMGALGDRVGRRRLLFLGAAGFALASIISAMSASAGMLIVARALLGVAGATLMPCALALVRTMFTDAQERRVAISALTGAAASGAALGPLIGALLLEHFWWGSVFLISVPAITLLLLAGPALLPETGRSSDARFDPVGAVMSLGAVLTVVYGIKQMATSGPGLLSLLSFAVGVTCGVLFVRRQRTRSELLLDPEWFRHRAFAVSLGLNVLAMFVMLGFTQFTMQYLQIVAGLGPWGAALCSLPAPIGMITAISAAAILAKTMPPSRIIAAGFTVAALGLCVMTQVGAGTPLVLLILGSILLASGIGATLGLIADLIISTAPAESTGAVAAMSETGKELGGALGTAILGAIGAAAYTGLMGVAMPTDLPDEARQVASQTVGGAAGVAEQVGDPLGPALLESAQHAFAYQLNKAAGAGIAVLIIGAMVAIVLLRGVRTTPADEPTRTPSAGHGAATV